MLCGVIIGVGRNSLNARITLLKPGMLVLFLRYNLYLIFDLGYTSASQERVY